MAPPDPLTTSGASYPPTLQHLALPLPALQALHPHLSAIAVGAFIFLPHTATLLLIRRSATEISFSGLWEIPGGGMEPPEIDATLLDAVVREVKEETGLTVTRIAECTGVRELVGRSGRRFGKWNFMVEVAEGREGVVLDPREHDEWLWVEGVEGLERVGVEMTTVEHRGVVVEALERREREVKEVGEMGER